MDKGWMVSERELEAGHPKRIVLDDGTEWVRAEDGPRCPDTCNSERRAMQLERELAEARRKLGKAARLIRDAFFEHEAAEADVHDLWERGGDDG